MALSAFAPVSLAALCASNASGSQVARVTLQQGVLTQIKSHARHEFLFNGEPVRPRPTSSAPIGASDSILSAFGSHADGMPFQIRQSTSLPPALGAPLAAAGALSLALALNEWHANPYSQKSLMRLVNDSLISKASAHVSPISLEGGLFYSSGRSQIRQPLSPAELRTPIRLSVFGKNTSPLPHSTKKSNLAAQKAMRLFRQKPHLLSLAFASRQYALESGLSNWARPLLLPRPTAGVVAGRKILFELGVSSTTAPVLLHSNSRPASSLAAPAIFIAHPSNSGARIWREPQLEATRAPLLEPPLQSALGFPPRATMTF